MRREEKRKRFHEALIQTLYPPAPSPPESEEEDDKKQVIASERAVNIGLGTLDDFEESKSSSPTTDDEDDGGHAETQKLSRAQRKRLRKKKLKEDAFRRGKIIGPLLQSSEYNGVGSVQAEPEGVRENAVQEQVASSDTPGNRQGNFSSKKKLKRRRTAKRLTREGLKSTEGENSDQDKERQVI